MFSIFFTLGWQANTKGSEGAGAHGWARQQGWAARIGLAAINIMHSIYAVYG